MKAREITVSLRCHETWLLCLYEKYIQSFPMLWCKDLSFWSKTQTMLEMSKNLESPNQEARSSSREISFCFARTNFSATEKSHRFESASLSHTSRLELSVSKNASKVRSKRIYSKISQRPLGPVARWDMVLVQESTVDSSSGCPQTGRRSLRHLLGPPASERARKPGGMDAIHRNDSSQGQKTHLRRRVRQFSQCQKIGSTKSLGASTVPFSFNPSIPIAERPLETWDRTSQSSRINLSISPSGSRTSPRETTSSCPQPFEQASTSSTNTSASNAHPRILKKHRLLPELSKSSVFASSQYYQYYRINEPINPRSHAAMRQSTHSRIAATLEHSLYTNAT